MTIETESLGTVTCPSGALMIVDFGLLRLWSHERPPLLEEWMGSPEMVAAANAARDYRVEGDDADAASRLFGKSPGYLYDRATGFPEVFAAMVAEKGLDARLVAIDRVPHRDRISRALATSRSGPVEFHGVWAQCLTGIPRDVPLRVLGTRMTGPEFDGRWSRVELRVRKGVVAVTEAIGEVPVDEARLGFFDIDALGAWIHDDPIDGLADFVFWGRDAREVAQEHDVPELGDGFYGWRDLPVLETVRRGVAIEALSGVDDRFFARRSDRVWVHDELGRWLLPSRGRSRGDRGSARGSGVTRDGSSGGGFGAGSSVNVKSERYPRLR